MIECKKEREKKTNREILAALKLHSNENEEKNIHNNETNNYFFF